MSCFHSSLCTWDSELPCTSVTSCTQQDHKKEYATLKIYIYIETWVELRKWEGKQFARFIPVFSFSGVKRQPSLTTNLLHSSWLDGKQFHGILTPSLSSFSWMYSWNVAILNARKKIQLKNQLYVFTKLNLETTDTTKPTCVVYHQVDDSESVINREPY